MAAGKTAERTPPAQLHEASPTCARVLRDCAAMRVSAAICCFLRHPGSFEEAVVEAASLGGDADTIASMTGAISGARLGIEAIPEEWVEKLENRAYIEELAVKLWEAALEQA